MVMSSRCSLLRSRRTIGIVHVEAQLCFRNIVSVALLALSCAQAFVSPEPSLSWGVGGGHDMRRRQPFHRVWRGGSQQPPWLTDAKQQQQQRSHSTSIHVLKAPPALQTFLLSDDERADDTTGGGSTPSSCRSLGYANGVNKDGTSFSKKQLSREMNNGRAAAAAAAAASSFRNGAAAATLTASKQQRGGSGGGSSSSSGSNSPQRQPRLAEYVAETKLPTDIGQFQLRAYRVPGAPLGQEPCVIYARDKPPMGTPENPARHIPVRIHDQCITSEVFRSQRCDCKEQLQMALHYIQRHGGFIVYLQQEGRGIGLANKIAAYALQDLGLDTVEANLHLGFKADQREYDIIPSILEDMNVASIQLMTNNPRKVERLTSINVDVERTLPMVVSSVNPYNRKYLETKRTRMNHSNLSALLAKDANGINNPNSLSHMTPLKPKANLISMADKYINNGTEMTANAVHVSLMVEDASPEPATLEGVKARSDGYCIGRESVEAAIKAMGRGELIVVVDDMDRENEGDFIMAADQCTALDMAQIIRYSSGVVCIALEDERLQELNLPPMVEHNQDPKGTAFTVTVDAKKKHGITTGISASDRAKTVQLLANPQATMDDFSRPGHILPLRAKSGGVLARDGHTEAAVDLCKLSGRQPAGVLCEIVSEENPTEMMRLPEIQRFCARHGYVLTSIVDIAQYRREMESGHEKQQQQQQP